MPVATQFAWSQYQQNIFDFVERGEGSAVVEACAGSAKTTTIVECARRIPSEDGILFIAFNKRVAEELKKRLPAYANALTLNALGFRAWRAFIEKNVEVDGNKVSAIVRAMSDDSNPEFKQGVKKLVDMAKVVGIVPEQGGMAATGLVEDSEESWRGLIDEYGINFGYGDKDDRGIALARRVLAENIRLGTEKIDFNDQLYLPIVFNADFTQYDWIFCDELQDVNGLQLQMLKRSLGRDGRFIGVGDEAQQIYSWRGAGKGSMRIVAEAFGARKFPLSVSYRCPKAVVERARQYTDKIELWENAIEGEVKELESWSPNAFLPTDVILCRNNAPLVALAFKIIRAGKGCRVLGRDIGTGLVALIRKMKALSPSDLLAKLDTHVRKERARLEKEGDEAKIISLLDRVDTIRVFVENVSTISTVDAVIAKIEQLFADDSPVGCVTLATIFKFKGLEASRVYILDFHLIGARGPEPSVAYVGITRSQKELYFINS